ncbi:hypothetical protein [Sphingobacterium bovistauri]|uniref:Major paralogous domain-containing protein n=1 Tax=Sphingobacterium bovistauri TaxID=2781959 RepID=A0ABS7ZC03_9SPHI|nr:hypothetical protein [Sphingobacterium bovistauri]MCA5006254.1 hypothetical protein [Sphingobacterium bovistauri]
MISYLRLFCFCFAVCVGLIGCFQEKRDIYSTSTLNINLEYAEYENSIDFKSSDEVDGIFKQEIPYNDEFCLEVNVLPVKKSQFKSSSFRRVIAAGTTFRILVFDANNKYLLSRDYVCGSLVNTDIQVQTDKNYSFIVYSFGKSTALPSLALNIGDDIFIAKLLLTSFEDVMSHSILNRLISRNDNTLSFVLKHTFTKIKTSIDAGTVGLINTIGNFSVTNTFSNAEIKYTNQQNSPFNLSFSGLITDRPLSSFAISNDNKSAFSNEQLIYADGIQQQKLKLTAMTIVNNVSKSDITLLEYVFKPGVYYEIDIKLKRTGHVVGPISYALGNLIGVLQPDGTYKYMMASSQGEYGDYWYKNADGKFYDTPQKHQATTWTGTLIEEVIDGDICRQVGPDWRLPTVSETQNLRSFGSWDGQWNNTTAYVHGHYKKPDDEIVYGLYFGTNVQPSVAKQDEYLFLPFAGAYNSQNKDSMYSAGFYWHSGNGHGFFQFGHNYFSPTIGADKNRANTIRCVKTNPLIEIEN